MKKLILSLSVASLAVAIATAGLQIVDRGSFSTTAATGTAGKFAINSGNGQIVNEAMMVYSKSNMTMLVYLPAYKTSMFTNYATASTSIVVHTTGSNIIDGYTIQTNDAAYMLVHQTVSNAWTLSSVYRVIGHTDGTTDGSTNATTYYVGTGIIAEKGDPVYVIRSADILSIPIVGGATYGYLNNQFVGYQNMPVYGVVPQDGAASTISGTYSVQD